MSWLVGVVAFLVAIGSVLAMAEASISRMTRARASALRADARRNAARLEAIERDPAAYLNAVYLAVMVVQNGSAILVAILAEQMFGEWWVTIASFVFTIAYFVVVEAMSKTFGILHSAGVALALAPVVWWLGRALSAPTRLLIGLANILLPGRGLKEGPFVTPDEIRSMAEVGRQEGTVEEQERELIHSVFELGGTSAREVMVPRPDVVATRASASLHDVLDLMLDSGHWRIPVHADRSTDVEGVAYMEDILRRLRVGDPNGRVASVIREPYVVPETKRAAELLREMQVRHVTVALVVDEYGSTAGMVTLEDLLAELVGDIGDERDENTRRITKIAEASYRVGGRVAIADLGHVLGVELPANDAVTVGGLVYRLLGRVPEGGETVRCRDMRFIVESVRKRRVLIVRVDAGAAV